LSDQYSSLPLPQTHGWTLSSDGVFGIDWEAPSVSPLQQEVESGSDSEYDMDGSSDEMPTETEVITEDFMFTVPEIV
jgi:hypothetical protein